MLRGRFELAVHAETIAGFLSAWVVTYVAVATYCLVAWVQDRLRRPARGHGELPYLLFGVLTLALAVYSGGCAAFYLAERRWPEALSIANGGRIAAIVLLVHLVLDYAGIPWRRRAMSALYAVAGLLEAANLAGYFFEFEGARERPVHVFGVTLREMAVPATPASVGFSIVSVAAVGLAGGVLARAFIRGSREVLASFLGISVLSVTVAHDALRAAGWLGGIELSPYGYAAFVMGVIATLLARYASLWRNLEARSDELRQRSRELSSSFDELRAAQSELVRKEQLAAVGELSAVVAHEIRNPLAIIANAVATLRRSSLEVSDRETLLGILEEESSRLNRLVGDLLCYARPVRVERQQLSLRELVERAMALTQGGASLSIELVEPEPVERVWGDPGLLRQAIENLITNAVQAMQSGGTLTLELGERTDGGVRGVELSIRDTGEGMDTSVRKRALDPFFTTRPSGTGLGLAIVARVVDAHGGRLRIESAAGAGTAVHVFLPIDGEPSNARLSVPDADRRSSLPPMPIELRRAMSGRR